MLPQARNDAIRQLVANAIALDIETSSNDTINTAEYALQPWRLTEGKARITCVSVAKHTGESKVTTTDYAALLKELEGQVVCTWNGVFDVAWLIAAGHWEAVKKIHWVDVMLLWKWVDNSQRKERMPKWSLGDGVKHWLKHEPWCEAFIKMKREEQVAGENDAYWEQRAKLDSIATAKICNLAVAELTDQQLKSAMIEAYSIPEIARSWLMGVTIDFNLLDSLRPVIVTEMRDLEFTLGVSNFSGAAAERIQRDTRFWSPSKILRSPDQLGVLLYETWGLTAKDFSEKTGKPSTDKAALTYLADHDDRVIEILRWRELNTQLSKYIEAPKKARKYLGSDVTHPAPRLFSTYTGRQTYSSKTKGRYQTGVALHQWPRSKQLRALIKPPPGYKHVEFDAAGQESRIMAEQSGDLNMKQVFQNDMDFHSNTGAAVSGLTYEAFMRGKEAGNTRIVGEHGLRYLGKVLNLSQNFRISVRGMRVSARVGYGMKEDYNTVKGWQDTFKRLYPGIPVYWKTAIDRAKFTGYAETLGGRRFKIDRWGKEDRWGSESSALMFPIQGSGADMKALALKFLSDNYPELIFFFDLHDGIHMLAELDYPNSKLIEARDRLDQLDYAGAWGKQPSVPLKWDVQVGSCWSTLKELKSMSTNLPQAVT